MPTQLKLTYILISKIQDPFLVPLNKRILYAATAASLDTSIKPNPIDVESLWKMTSSPTASHHIGPTVASDFSVQPLQPAAIERNCRSVAIDVFITNRANEKFN